jgi:cysteine-rich repeat protein
MKTRLLATLLLASACQRTGDRGAGAESLQRTGGTSAQSEAKPDPTAIPASSCGNGHIDPGETCDDGNQLPGDGCSPRCRLEVVGFASYYWVLSDGTLRSRRPRITEFNGRTAVEYSDTAALMEGVPQEIGPMRGPGVPVPEVFRGKITHVISDNDSACVTVEGREVWCSLIRQSTHSNCGKDAATEDEIYLADHPVRWCRERRPPNEVKQMTAGHYLLEKSGQLVEFGPFSRPTVVNLGSQRVRSVAGSFAGHACVLNELGEVGCWGIATYGQLGYMGEPWDVEDTARDPFIQETPPTQFLRFASPVKRVRVDGGTTCALLGNGELWCWGQIGPLPLASTKAPEPYLQRMKDGHDYKKPGESTLPSSPLEVPPGCRVQDFTTFGCALCEPGCWKCWGYNDASPADAQCLEF